MILNLLKPLLGPIVNKALKLIPDPTARKEAQESLEREILSAVREADTVQAEINMVEASHASLFVAGWRPSIGWICSLGLAWSYIIHPLLGIWCDNLPALETDSLYQLVLGMLGMGALRSWEKTKGVSREK